MENNIKVGDYFKDIEGREVVITQISTIEGYIACVNIKYVETGYEVYLSYLLFRLWFKKVQVVKEYRYAYRCTLGYNMEWEFPYIFYTDDEAKNLCWAGTEYKKLEFTGRDRRS